MTFILMIFCLIQSFIISYLKKRNLFYGFSIGNYQLLLWLNEKQAHFNISLNQKKAYSIGRDWKNELSCCPRPETATSE